MRTLAGNKIENLTLRFKLAGAAKSSIIGWFVDLPAQEQIIDRLLGRRLVNSYNNPVIFATNPYAANYETAPVVHYFLNAA